MKNDVVDCSGYSGVYFYGVVFGICEGIRAHYSGDGYWMLFCRAPEGLPVSIIIPARNEEHETGLVMSALSQDHPNVEVVVLNDGSTDRTGEILRYSTAFKRLKLPESDGESLPEGWFGKPWALQRAQRLHRALVALCGC